MCLLSFVFQRLPFLMAASLLRCRLLPVFFINSFSWSCLSSKESACSAGDSRDTGSIPGSEISGEGHGIPLQYSCLENPHGQRSLGGYSPRGHKELDMTERPNNHKYAIQQTCNSAWCEMLSVFLGRLWLIKPLIGNFYHSLLFEMLISFFIYSVL